MKATLNVGMIGLDTSHCEGLVQLLNDAQDPHHVPGARVVQAYPGGTQTCAVSRDRVHGFTETLRDKHGIRLCASIEDTAKGMDAFLLTSVDGRQHLEQLRILARFGKPVFVDKPFACSSTDAHAMVDIMAHCQAPLMSCSSLHFAAGVARTDQCPVRIQACETFGPMAILDDYPAYFWYGIHSADLLYAYMGTGCRQVRTIHEKDMDLLVGQWPDGRIGMVRGLRHEGKKPFGRILFTGDGVVYDLEEETPPPAALLADRILKFFHSGESPIAIQETLEIVAFLEAAESSMRQGGLPVTINSH